MATGNSRHVLFAFYFYALFGTHKSVGRTHTHTHFSFLSLLFPLGQSTLAQNRHTYFVLHTIEYSFFVFFFIFVQWSLSMCHKQREKKNRNIHLLHLLLRYVTIVTIVTIIGDVVSIASHRIFHINSFSDSRFI